MKNKLKFLRRAASMTQSELAEKAGVSRQTVYAIEKGKYVPSVRLALRLAKILHVKVEDIFRDE